MSGIWAFYKIGGAGYCTWGFLLLTNSTSPYFNRLFKHVPPDRARDYVKWASYFPHRTHRDVLVAPQRPEQHEYTTERLSRRRNSYAGAGFSPRRSHHLHAHNRTTRSHETCESHSMAPHQQLRRSVALREPCGGHISRCRHHARCIPNKTAHTPAPPPRSRMRSTVCRHAHLIQQYISRDIPKYPHCPKPPPPTAHSALLTQVTGKVTRAGARRCRPRLMPCAPPPRWRAASIPPSLPLKLPGCLGSSAAQTWGSSRPPKRCPARGASRG